MWFYSAAKAAGLSDSGSVLATPDGQTPPPEQWTRNNAAALERAGVMPWEGEQPLLLRSIITPTH